MSDVITLVHYNEVYNKVICDPGISMEIADNFTFDVPGAKFTPAFKSKFWDGRIKLYNPMVSLLYSGLTHHLEQFCSSRDYTLNYEGPFADSEFSLIEAKTFIEKLNPKHQPRDYQLDAFVHAVRKRRAILLSPTGSGKSLIIYLLACWYRSKTLVIVPTTSLVHQMTSDFEDYGLPVGMTHKITSGIEKDSTAPFVVSTWQSVFRMPKQWFDQFELVIGDECHLFKAKSLTSIMSKLTDCKYKFGFTGTLDGVNCSKLQLEALFGPVRKVTTTVDLIDQKHLAEFNIKAIVLKYPDDTRKIMARADYQSEIDFLVKDELRNRFIKNLALSLTGNTLLLFNYVEKHGKPLFDAISKEVIDRNVYFISGSVDGKDREHIRATIEKESNSIIVASFGTSSTGINIKNLHNIIFSSPSKSRIRNLQSIGRALRTSDTKESATLYDIADDLSWKSSSNHTIRHFIERVKIYNEENFPYKVYNVGLK